MDMTKDPKNMTALELSTAVYHISANNQTAKTFTLQKVSNILLEASRRLSGQAERKPPHTDLDSVRDAVLGQPEATEGDLTHYTRLVSYDNVTGKVTEKEYETKLKTQMEEIRRANQESSYESLSERIKRDWAKPEDLEDFFGDPRENGDL
jgi:hypothetical protein